MQISPLPGIAWPNPAAAVQQAATDQRTKDASTSGTVGADKPSIGDVERTSETMDRDANGQYDGSAMQRDSESEDSKSKRERSQEEPQHLLELPALEQPGELDLLG